MTFEQHLHIVSFNIPLPADNGGDIDVFYKIKALRDLKVKIHLHCFEYGRERSKELEEYCYSVNYYVRKTNISTLLNEKPYIVASRKSIELEQELLKDIYPILIEGIHCSAILQNPKFEKRKIICRMTNVEHSYYYHLFKSENKNILNKLYYLSESIKLYFYEEILTKTDGILAISQTELKYFQEKYQKNRCELIPAFHSPGKIDILEGKGTYALYHGYLKNPENNKAAQFLVNKVFSKLPTISFKIAGFSPSLELKKLVSKYNNIEIIDSPTDQQMESIIQNAHINILYTFQDTGIKLKLLHALHKGRFCIVNSKMLSGSGLDDTCYIANTTNDIIEKIMEVFSKSFSQAELEKRKKILAEKYSNLINAKKIIDLL